MYNNHVGANDHELIELKNANKLAKKGDIIAVLGKGNEDYQDIDGQHIFHSDKKIIMEMQ